ncbi:MAG TPA: TerB family tellurite resistance protein [Gammaproteobacteria bacterium]|jgi:uncharacterized tellurite resistance protein B-like protein|nr:TerB family tellurite resistance protein [Gammaproteobacteria bacterium]
MIDEIAKLMIATSMVDGHAHTDEATALGTVLGGLGYSQEKTMALVNEAFETNDMPSWVMDSIDSLNTMGTEQKQMALASMMLMAMADGVVDPSEVTLIDTVANALGMELPKS